MKRCSSALAMFALVASLAGCAMCRCPFDYCAPVAGPDGCQNCNFNARRGSLFDPMDGSADLQMTPTLAPGATESVESAAQDESTAVDYEEPAGSDR